MFNILIVDNDTTFISFLINNIISKFKNLRIVGICYDSKNAINSIIFQQVDITISNYKLFCNIANLMSKENIECCNTSFIVISENSSNHLDIPNSIVSSIILKNKVIEKI